MGALGVVAMAGGLLGGAACAAEPDQNNTQAATSLIPPQTLPQGFGITGELLRDQKEAGTRRFTPPGSSKAAGS